MSHRVAITEAFINKIKSELSNNNSNKYYTDIEGCVSKEIYKFDEIREFPHIGIQQGSESFQYLPSKQKWHFLSLSVLIYVQNQEDPQEELERLIADLEIIIDSEDNLQYTVIKPDGTSIIYTTEDIQGTSLTTDEGILKPFGLAEYQITIKYSGDRILY